MPTEQKSTGTTSSCETLEMLLDPASALDLDQASIITFLEYWGGDFDDKYEVPILSKKARVKGEIFQLRGLLRNRYPGSQVTLSMIVKALESKPEWEIWAIKLQVLLIVARETATFVVV
jgi:hypothetical protein